VTCREFAEFIMDYLTGELGADVRAIFERHLSRCPACHEYLAQYEQTVRAGRLAFGHLDEVVPAEVPEDLVRAILASRRI
jgi:anti-sigma factor RsiW